MLGLSLGDFVSVTRQKSRLAGRHYHDEDGGGHGRIIAVKLLTVAAFLGLLSTLIKTQIFAGAYFHGLAMENRIAQIPIHAPRGIIYDRNDVPLTANLPGFRFNNQTISKDQAIELEVAGKQAEVDSIRSYLYGPAFAHLTGYVSEDSSSDGYKTGKGGVEEFYEDKLRGVDGKDLIEVDAVGKKLRTISTVPPVPGSNLTLTIDAQIQKTAYAALDGQNGVVVATNPNTGEILALVSVPAFDPNNIAASLNDPKQSFFNRAVSGTFPPGSTFKLVTAAAGLETGSITAGTIIEDTGILVIGPYKFPNWKYLAIGGVEGPLDVVGAIQKSNDIFFYKAGEATGIDNLIVWAKRFGLEAPLGIDLPGEAKGLIKLDRDWYLGDTYHTAIGQGDVLATPLQVNFWTAVIANGGKLCRPHVLAPDKRQKEWDKGQENGCKDLGIKKETIDLIKKGMIGACSPGGTAWPLFDFKPQIACKTGTAEYGDPALKKTHGWLTLFAPADPPAGGPEIAVTVLVEGGGEGSDVAAPVAKKILEQWFGSNP